MLFKKTSKSGIAQPDLIDSLLPELFALAERSANAGTWSWNVKTNEFFWSRGMYELFDFDIACDVPGFEAWRSRLHPEDVERSERAIYRSIENRLPLAISYRIVRRDGKVRWVDAFGDTQLDGKGKPERMSGFCIDSTARIALETDKVALEMHLVEMQRLETDLRLSEKRLELALSGSGLGCWDEDLPTRMVIADRAISEMLGYSIEELGRPGFWNDLHHPQDRAQYEQRLAAHLQGESETFNSQHRLRHKVGHWIVVEALGRVVARDEQGTPLRMVGTMRDITQHKRLNEEGLGLLKQIEAMIRATTDSTPGAPSDEDPAAKLTRRQRQLITMIAKGMTSAQIAQSLKIATGTAMGHRRDLMRKLNLHSAQDVTRFAIKHKLIAE